MFDKLALMTIDVLMALQIGLLMYGFFFPRFYALFFLAYAYITSATLKKPTAPFIIALGVCIALVPFVQYDLFSLLIFCILLFKGFKRLA